jgi:hypothetical protein
MPRRLEISEPERLTAFAAAISLDAFHRFAGDPSTVAGAMHINASTVLTFHTRDASMSNDMDSPEYFHRMRCSLDSLLVRDAIISDKEHCVKDF